MSQLLNLLLLAPDIQIKVLFLPPSEKGCEPPAENDLRRLATEPNWTSQRRLGKAC